MRAMDGDGEAVRPQRATLGYCLGERGDGVAFVRWTGGAQSGRTVRVPFRCEPLPALRGRDVAYAAVLASLRALRRLGARHLVLEIADAELVDEVARHRTIPPLTVPYLMLGCELNRFKSVALCVGSGSELRDLSARARADVLLHVAA